MSDLENLFKEIAMIMLRRMAKTSRSAVKTLSIVKSRDIVVERMLKPCQEDNHSKCTGWAVIRKEVSPIDANYFLKCTCACHHQKKGLKKKVQQQQLIRKKQAKKKAKERVKKAKSSRKLTKKSKRTRRR